MTGIMLKQMKKSWNYAFFIYYIKTQNRYGALFFIYWYLDCREPRIPRKTVNGKYITGVECGGASFLMGSESEGQALTHPILEFIVHWMANQRPDY